ncbi:1-acyl-sn-glycerol-3-phosphate acyltransferase [Tomitella cavernea]|uniref:Glycerol-3-phosphate 1-O-acyltransferase n=1 Tax=Tomitella cavernea TaxID=1387982 RepID=A0ABP9CH09_9ACTN|nr:1-acyl-sn-glycerol-3-phosphate acyltransferase [Tomitella cavernea]
MTDTARSLEDSDTLFLCDAEDLREMAALAEWVRSHHPGGRTRAHYAKVSFSGTEAPDTAELAAAVASSDEDTTVVPVRRAWVPARSTQDSTPRFRDLVLGDPARPRNQIARRLRRDDPARHLVVLGAGATIADLRARYEAEGVVDGAVDDVHRESFDAFIARHADLTLDVEERGLRGRRYKVPRFVIPGIEARAGYRAAVADAARTLGRPAEEIRTESHAYLQELVATPSTFFIDWMGTLTRWITSLGYRRVVTDPANVERARAMMRDNPSALLWTHKSYIDAIALMSVMYDNDFPAPHSIGGINMAFAGVGYAGRRSGTVFIRRKFNDNPVYKLALRQYLGFLMAKRFPLSWSFEGTRSRSGIIGRPRFGLLKYAIDAAHATGTEDLHLIPVSINYDLIGETAEYAREEAGKPKETESLGWFVDYLRRLRAPMGDIYLDFAEPVVLDGVAPEPTPELLRQVSTDVARRANACVPVTMASLLCLVLLGTQPRALTRVELDQATREIVRWLKARGVRLEDPLRDGDLATGETLFQNALGTGVLRHSTGASVELIGLGRGQDLVAGYYRNTIVHYFIEKAVAEVCVATVASAPAETRVEAFDRTADELHAMLRATFFLPSADEFRRAVDKALSDHDADWRVTLARPGEEPVHTLLGGFRPLVAHSTLLPFIEARWIVSTVVAGLAPDEATDKQEIIAKSLRYGRTALERQLIVGESSVGKAMLEGGYTYLSEAGLLDPGEDADAKVAKRRAARAHLESIIDAIVMVRSRAHAQLFDLDSSRTA